MDSTSSNDGSKVRPKKEEREGYEQVFSKTITLRNGKVLRAEECGKAAFMFWVKKK
ncbi:hypothetical protein CA51_11080 [Rosistilla oblonga]|uniref:hypothetical protein n=1 Tax=Rosistilla oblonga TaxID=2527990 RepID=UPI00118C6B74|nr:hypothetical protein [Rosistilla oblonga]QDV11247.1 hypothetical protein CA51_11080 [Rosistilla oblonga]